MGETGTSEGTIEKPQLSKELHILPRNKSPRPFIKWAGGKSQLLQKLEQHVPNHFDTYYEPFLGGGAMFFYLVEKRPRFSAVLSDINEELITTNCVVKEKVEDLIKRLKGHKMEYLKSPKRYYYDVRAEEPTNDVEKAARLIFLNKTCYNGLYRVNKKGRFNVPFGKHKNPRICDEENLQVVSRV